MDSQFWITAWKEGRTAFHQNKVHEKLIAFFSLLEAKEGQKILVPLCGKTKDLLWLNDQKLQVHGVELHDEAVKEFFADNKLSPVNIIRESHYVQYRFQNILISNGDFFKLEGNETYDMIYDRASLVALPAPMRKAYAEVLKRVLKKGGMYLLVVYDYDQSQLEGPPFSVSDREIRELYENAFSIKLLESTQALQEGSRLSSLGEGIKQNIYLLEKR